MFLKTKIKISRTSASSRFLIKKTWKKYLLLLIISFLQIAFAFYPNFVLFYALASQSLFMAWLGGFLLDLYSPLPFGVNMLAFLCLTIIFNYLSRKVLQRNYLFYIIIGLISLGYNIFFLWFW